MSDENVNQMGEKNKQANKQWKDTYSSSAKVIIRVL